MLALLESVDFSANPMTRIPETMVNLASLKHLKINAISLERFPENFGDLKTLETLEARENMVMTLPETICELPNLQYLDLGENEITKLPEKFGKLSNLLELWMDDNDLTSLPESIGGLVNLTLADFTKNKLEQIPDSISNCVNISVLTLKENYLSYLPHSIGSLKKLSELTVDNNKLCELTESIGQCVALTELILTENLIQVLPESVACLCRLGVLNLGRNRITHLPEKIGKCKALRMLFLRENHLERIPETIGDLKNLQTLDVAGNRLDYLPDSLLQLDIKAVWLSANQAQPLVAFQEDTVTEDGVQKKVLTCFLLPQHKFNNEDYVPQPLSQKIPTSESLTQPIEQAPKIQFEAEEEESKSDENTGFNRVRDFTPLPKDRDRMKQEALNYAQKKQQEEDEKERAAEEKKEQELVEDETDELDPLIVHNESESLDDSREQAQIQQNGVRFDQSVQEEEPMEHRLKRTNTPHYKREARLTNMDPPGNLIIDNKPNLNLSASPKVLEVILDGAGSYGLSIAGGLGSPPYIQGDNGVFISRVAVNGRAEAGGIEVGDKIAKVNGVSVLDKTHEDVVDILRQCREVDSPPQFVLYRYPLIEGFQPFVNESDSEDDAEDTAFINGTSGINAQLDFSVLSSDSVDEKPLPIPEFVRTPVQAPDADGDSMPPPPLTPKEDRMEEPETQEALPLIQPVSPSSVTYEPESTTIDPSIPEPLSFPNDTITNSNPSPSPSYLSENVSDPVTPNKTQSPPITPSSLASPSASTAPQPPIDFQSPKPFIAPERLPDGAQLSFKEKMKMFKTGPSANARPQTRTKISLVNNQDLSSIRADENRKLISQSAAQLRQEKFFDMNDSEDLYRQTADLDNGAGGDQPPKIKRAVTTSKMENPLDALGGNSTGAGNSHIPRGADLTDLEREASLSLGNSVSPREWERDVERSRKLRMERMKEMDDDAKKAQKVLRRERSLKGENFNLPTTR